MLDLLNKMSSPLFLILLLANLVFSQVDNMYLVYILRQYITLYIQRKKVVYFWALPELARTTPLPQIQLAWNPSNAQN